VSWSGCSSPGGVLDQSRIPQSTFTITWSKPARKQHKWVEYVMADIFATMPVLVGDKNSRLRRVISITSPKFDKEKGFYCQVKFDGASKCGKIIYSSDGITSLSLTIVHMKGIVNNSKDPEFFWHNGDTMFVSRGGD